MEEFFQSTTIKVITLVLVVIVFIATPILNGVVNRKLPESLRGQHAKLAKDAWVKTILLFAGSVTAGLLAFFNGGFDKAISQAFFGLCLFSSLSSIWTTKKTSASIEEAKQLSITGNREARIADIETVNKEKAIKSTYISFFIGLLGFVFVALLFDKFSFSWVWFAAFISTGFGIQSARWSEAANLAISKYASDPSHGQ